MTDPTTAPASAPTDEPGSPLRLPRVVYGSSALGNQYQVISEERKLAMVRAWLEHGGDTIVIDSAGKYGAGLALEVLGKCLRRLGADPERVTISNKLAWLRTPLRGREPRFEPGVWFDLEHDAEQRISGEGILDCWRQGLELLGEPYTPRMMSVHDPDEYLAAGDDDARWRDVLEAYQALAELCKASPGCSLGVGAKDWRVAKRIADAVRLDWVMLANCVTIHSHPPEALAFLHDLANRNVAVVNSGVFNAGFLVGGRFFNYRIPTPSVDAELFRWREAFELLCRDCDVRPAHACVQFGLSPEGVQSVALSTVSPQRVQENLEFATAALPDVFWREAKSRGLIDSDYPYLGV